MSTKRSEKQEQKEEPLPRWMDTPEPIIYHLAMLDQNELSAMQEIEVSREEFICLKVCLAELRGLIPSAGAASA